MICVMKVCYDNGIGVEKDKVEALYLYRLVAELGDASAQYNLGCAYFTGDGVQIDKIEAVRWWRQAAGSGMFRPPSEPLG